ncbi:MAG: chemotaxis-specific protein-glutamate methyltransferase CheB [Chlamydiales bacterium]|nr:chemotaxis-specific protein-glutamate methyltransferase CheB [Chlamydiales bacterium]
MTKDRISVLIVDDSRVSRDLIAHIISSDPDLKIAGFAKDGDQALEWLTTNTADVITMDVVMPGANGFEIARRIMESKPIPIVIVSAAYNPSDDKHGFEAMEAGALAILEKPGSFEEASFHAKAQEIIDTIKTVAEVKLIRRRIPRAKVTTPIVEKLVTEGIEAVAIGASLGGPIAISTVLSGLPASFPIPIFIVQHIAAGFTAGFATWLQDYTPLKVIIPGHGEKAQPGCCYIAPSDCHMEVRAGNIIYLVPGPADPLQPSVSRLFKSMAKVYGPKCVGIILTGMGRDGADELLVMKNRGAITIAQDEESCVMYGMPKEAAALGAAKQVLPLDQIAKTLTGIVMPARPAGV